MVCPDLLISTSFNHAYYTVLLLDKAKFNECLTRPEMIIKRLELKWIDARMSQLLADSWYMVA